MELSELYEWCSVPVEKLPAPSETRVPYRVVEDSATMGELLAREFVDEIREAGESGRSFNAIVPCGPKSWYEPFRRLVNAEQVSLRHVTIFHMDECLDWQGRLLHPRDPHNFRTFMEEFFYGGIDSALAVPLDQRIFPEPNRLEDIRARLAETEIDLTIGGFGQDGHIAYNQARRNPYSQVSLAELRSSEIRIQENNADTIIALAQRTFGSGYQFVPPMSITLGVKECLKARRVRLYSDTGAWKQTAFRVALFSEETVEYPVTLLQSHPDALLTVTLETARHPIAEHPEWSFTALHPETQAFLGSRS